MILARSISNEMFGKYCDSKVKLIVPSKAIHQSISHLQHKTGINCHLFKTFRGSLGLTLIPVECSISRIKAQIYVLIVIRVR